MDPRDPFDPNNRIRQFDPNAPRKNREGMRRPPTPSQAAPVRGTGMLRTPTTTLRAIPPAPSQPPSAAYPASNGEDSNNPFELRLDPNSPPGEFNFLMPQASAPAIPSVGLIAESEGPIPPQLLKAVDEVMGFIYGLDQQFENQGRRPKKR